MKQIVVINGKPQAGKKTFASMVGRHFLVRYRNSIDPIKEAARLIGWEGRYRVIDRSFLCALKASSIKYADFSFKWAQAEIEDFMKSDDEVLFLSVREPNEIKKLRHMYPTMVSVLIARKHALETQNPADKGVEDYLDYTYEFSNDKRLDDLQRKATTFASDILARHQQRERNREKFRKAHRTDDV